MKSKIWRTLLSLFCLSFLLCPSAFSDDSIVDSGTWKYLDWSLDNGGVLTISSNSEEGSTAYSVPWGAYREQITSAHIEYGVLRIPNYAFYNCSKLAEVSIANSVTDIGSWAFSGCSILNNVAIPENVSSIGNNAFENCVKITGVTIPYGVNTISNSLFRGCTSLAEVSIPESVSTIENWAFSECRSLTEVALPENLLSIGYRSFFLFDGLEHLVLPNNLQSIDEFCFTGCSKLTSGAIPASVTRIGEAAFSGCKSISEFTVDAKNTTYCSQGGILFSVDQKTLFCCLAGKSGVVSIPEGVIYIEASAFSGCGELTGIIIPETVTSFGESAFSGCGSMTEIELPEGITTISKYAFHNCTGLTEISIPSNVTALEDYAFRSCTGLLQISIPDNVTVIGQEAFYGCKGLTEASLGESVSEVGDSAFRFCSKLARVTLPESLAAIGEYAFYSCSALRNVYYGGIEEQWNALPIGTGNGPLYSATLHCLINSGVLDDVEWALNYQGVLTISGTGPIQSFGQGSTEAWRKYGNRIRSVEICEGITEVGNFSLADCINLSKITFSNSVVSIGYGAFKNCEWLTKIEFSDGLNSISGEAFADCSLVSKISIPSHVVSIGSKAFYNCSNLNEVQLPNSVTYIGENAFQNCPKLQTAGPADGDYNIKLGWTDSIPSKAFYNMTSLKSVVIPDGVTTIGRLTFAGCANLTWLTIPNSVYTIYHTSEGVSPFSGCPGLKTAGPDGGNYNISLGWNRIIPQEAFYNFSELEKVVIPTGVGSITRMAFYGCTGLADITIPESVTFFGDDAFEGCSGLITAGPAGGEYNVKYEWAETIPEWAFSTFSDLEETTIAMGISSIEASAFTGCKKLTKISLPEGVSNIGGWAFSDCSGLNRVMLPKSLISIGNGAFFQCANLAEVYYAGMKAEAETISVGTNNERLTSATWHYKKGETYSNNLTVRPVGDPARAVVSGGSISLQVEATAVDTIGLSYEWEWYDRTANYWKTIEASGNDDVVTVNNITEDMIIHCVVTDWFEQRRGTQFNVYVNKPGHQCGTNLDWGLENGILTIFGSGEMYQYFNEDGFRAPWAEQLDEIHTVVFENGVESVGDYAFSDAINLKNISFADTVWIIGDHAFQRSGVMDVYLPDAKYLNINAYAFEGCQSLETVSIGKTPEKILEYAFSNCPNLHLITYRGLFNSIGQSEEFHGLTATIQYPCNIVELYRETYYSNANAMEGTNSATAISASTGEPVVTAAPTDDQILANIEAAKRDIKMSNTKSNLTFEKFHTYEDGVCARCGERVPTILRLPSGLNTVGSESFMSTAADQIIIPAGVNVIEPHAFYDCPNLKILYFEGDPETIAPEIVNEGVAIYCEPGGNVDSWAQNRGLATVYR